MSFDESRVHLVPFAPFAHRLKRDDVDVASSESMLTAILLQFVDNTILAAMHVSRWRPMGMNCLSKVGGWQRDVWCLRSSARVSVFLVRAPSTSLKLVAKECFKNSSRVTEH
jgi:hypothetical protein